MTEKKKIYYQNNCQLIFIVAALKLTETTNQAEKQEVLIRFLFLNLKLKTFCPFVKDKRNNLVE